MESKLSYAIGDVVRLTEFLTKRSAELQKYDEHLICECKINGCGIVYATDHIAWVDSEDVIFVREATEESIHAAIMAHYKETPKVKSGVNPLENDFADEDYDEEDD